MLGGVGHDQHAAIGIADQCHLVETELGANRFEIGNLGIHALRCVGLQVHGGAGAASVREHDKPGSPGPSIPPDQPAPTDPPRREWIRLLHDRRVRIVPGQRQHPQIAPGQPSDEQRRQRLRRHRRA
ncbi:MAG: hypothetical protein QOJ54_2172 [Aliidongia sp.]|nr:hypothetical protein [Aliidongia sp.]